MQNSKVDLKVGCYRFSLDIISLTDALPNKRSAWVISDQLIRAATSIGANIVEARASSSRLEFKKFYEIALKSANETKYWLALLKELSVNNADKIQYFLNETTEIAKIIGSSVLTLKGKTKL